MIIITASVFIALGEKYVSPQKIGRGKSDEVTYTGCLLGGGGLVEPSVHRYISQNNSTVNTFFWQHWVNKLHKTVFPLIYCLFK